MSLADKRKLYPNMPDIEYLPKGKRCLVYRLEGSTRSAGGLVIPDEFREVKSRGILMAAGLAALDDLDAALIEIGDEVCFARFSGDDREVKREEGKAKTTIMECFADDIAGSVEAIERSKGYDVVIGEDGDGNRCHVYEPKSSKKGRAA